MDNMSTPQRNKAPPGDQPTWEEGAGQPAVQGFGWSPQGPSGLSSARGRQPGPSHVAASPPQHKAHAAGRAGELMATAPSHSPAKLAQGMALAPQALAAQPMQLVAHLLPAPPAGSIAVPMGSAAAPPGSTAVQVASGAPVQPLLMMCQSFFGSGGVKQVVQAGLQSPTSMRWVR